MVGYYEIEDRNLLPPSHAGIYQVDQYNRTIKLIDLLYCQVFVNLSIFFFFFFKEMVS